MFLVFLVTLFCIPQISAAASTGEMNKQIVYVDGVEVEMYVDRNFNVVVQTVGQEENAEMIITKSGNAEVSVESNGKTTELDVEINALSENNVDVEISQDGIVLDSVNNVDELILDDYDGQFAAAIPIVVLTAEQLALLLLGAFLMMYGAKIINGVLMIAVETFQTTVQKVKDLMNSYFDAVVVPDDTVYVNPKPISNKTAITRIKIGRSIYTLYQDNAKSAVKSAGMGVSKAEHHKKVGKIGIFLWHFHTLNKTPNVKDESLVAHSFYGTPVI